MFIFFLTVTVLLCLYFCYALCLLLYCLCLCSYAVIECWYTPFNVLMMNELMYKNVNLDLFISDLIIRSAGAEF